MGDTYNNVGATGLIVRSNHYCPVIMGDNIICWRLDGDKPGVCGMYIGGTNNRYWTERYWTNRYWVGRCWTIRYWTGRPDRSPLHSWGWTLLNCVLTKCQTKGSTMSFLTPKYDLVDSEGLLERFAKYRLMQTGALERHSGGCWEGMGVLFLLPVPNGSLFITI